MEELLIKEIEELERLGVICRVIPIPPSIYLIIPRDFCKDNIKDNIVRIKSIGARVFSKVIGVNEYYNVHGYKLNRTRKLTDDELYRLAHDFLDKAIPRQTVDEMMSVSENRTAYKELSKCVTKEELDEVLNHIRFIKIIRGEISIK